ncbi:hypothetical protein NP493_1512g00040 [Ridgeia piscesae]|uniref:Uncharacterized protein n=1 Tax=Ridgeia piscesae TaxID=27915 RepID=A0AAD9K0J8_RIDPI|nr:hypothetical protein NP493_1512g00040 [Ridgeia piscesae]
MDRFELSVNQVNFEGNDLEQFSSIHSFGNLVSYESDLKNADPTSEPVMAKRVLEDAYQDGEASGGPEYAELPGLVEHNFEGYLAHSFSRHGQNNVVKTSRSSESLVVNVGQGNDTVSDVSVSREVTLSGGDRVTQTQTSTDDIQPPQSPSVTQMFGLDASVDTFHAFTKTVEALALQESVIDNKNITPASAEDVARAIAEAQLKLSSSQMEPLQQDINPDNIVSIVVTDEKSSLVSGDKSGASHVNGVNDSSDVMSPDQGDTSQDTSSNSLNHVDVADPGIKPGEAAGTSEGNIHEGNIRNDDGPTLESTLRDHELIRIPSDQMIRMTETSSWFSRVTSSSSPMSSAPDRQQVALSQPGDDQQVGHTETTDDGAVAMTTRDEVQESDENGHQDDEDGLEDNGNRHQRLDIDVVEREQMSDLKYA